MHIWASEVGSGISIEEQNSIMSDIIAPDLPLKFDNLRDPASLSPCDPLVEVFLCKLRILEPEDEPKPFLERVRPGQRSVLRLDHGEFLRLSGSEVLRVLSQCVSRVLDLFSGTLRLADVVDSGWVDAGLGRAVPAPLNVPNTRTGLSAATTMWSVKIGESEPESNVPLTTRLVPEKAALAVHIKAISIAFRADLVANVFSLIMYFLFPISVRRILYQNSATVSILPYQ